MNLPPIPAINWNNDYHPDVVADLLVAYGKACRDQALEEAAKVCEDNWHMAGSYISDAFAKEIRGLK